jgi:predicted Zn-dependent protease
MKKLVILLLLISVSGSYNSCDKNKNVVLFTVQDDLKLGQQVAGQIDSDTLQYPVLSESKYPGAYNHMRRIVNTILNSGKIKYRDEFAWEVKIIHNDSVMNAFCTPGGYIYVYTGIIKYLDNEDELAGVLGHEMGHADLRHGSRQLQNQYGINYMLDLILGNNPNQLEQVAGQIAGSLVGLKYSRTYESEADNNSVLYLSGTSYACNGASGFFKKLRDSGQCNSTQLIWLSTHPAPCDRIDAIDAKAIALGCKTEYLNPPSYQDFKNSLP